MAQSNNGMMGASRSTCRSSTVSFRGGEWRTGTGGDPGPVEKERKRKRERKRECVRESEKKRESEREKESEGERERERVRERKECVSERERV